MNPHPHDVFNKLLELLDLVADDMFVHNVPLKLWHDDAKRNVILYQSTPIWQHIVHANLVSSATRPWVIIRIWREDTAHALKIRLLRFRRDNNTVIIKIVSFYQQRTL